MTLFSSKLLRLGRLSSQTRRRGLVILPRHAPMTTSSTLPLCHHDGSSLLPYMNPTCIIVRFKSSMPIQEDTDDDSISYTTPPPTASHHDSTISRSSNNDSNNNNNSNHDRYHGKKKVIPFLLADIGEGIAEVEILQWFVRPGDTVRQFDRICQVQSDKATVEITSRYDGVVESIANDKDNHDDNATSGSSHGTSGSGLVQVGSPLLHILVDDLSDDSSDNDDSNGEAKSLSTSSSSEIGSGHLHNVDEEQDKLHIPTFPSSFDIGQAKPKVLTTPAVRKLSMDYCLDLGSVVGTGPKGRVLKADVLKILRDKNLLDEVREENRDIHQDPIHQHPIPERLASELSGLATQDEVVPIRGYNRLMVKTMTESLTIPHMCYSDEINMNAALSARTTVGIKVLPLAIKAASLAMKDYPVLNSSLQLDAMTVTYHTNHNIGVAMDTPRGLCVPVVKNCQNLSLQDISDELQRLKEAASNGNLTEGDISGATFTLSNIGAIGGTYMSPIVASPQVAIGAMGKIQRLPRFVMKQSAGAAAATGTNTLPAMEEVVEAVHILQISWGGDHRVVDGATMARFSNRWKDLMENPMSMILCMK